MNINNSRQYNQNIIQVSPNFYFSSCKFLCENPRFFKILIFYDKSIRNPKKTANAIFPKLTSTENISLPKKQKDLVSPRIHSSHYKNSNFHLKRKNLGKRIQIKMKKNIKKDVWRKLKIFFSSIIKLGFTETKMISSNADIDKEFQYKTKISFTEKIRQIRNSSVFDELKKKRYFFDLLEKGDIDDLPWIENYIDNDPKRKMYNKENSNRRMNQYNERMQTPLYVACQNGLIDFVEFLLLKGANPHLKSKIGHSFEENILSLVIRHNYYNIFELLIHREKWSNEEIKEALQITTSKKIEEILEGLLSISKSKNCLNKFCKILKFF